ncbi:MAG: peptidoglycan DD-metalloendopeptidase family protein [Candidatus Obscuribacterales bacterium]|nr:peptidoglycan DD-metalloendopeptidase family protein [Steroidobacteraceae bacterium]
MSTRLILLSISALMLLTGCAGDPPPRAASTYTVKAGDTLYSIAWRHGVDYREVAKLNGIGRDYAIKPGQVLRLRSSARTAAAKPITPRETPRVAVRTGPPVDWSWPTRGVRTALTTRPNGGQGLTIEGEVGQEIRAAGSGRVVYTGSGMLGYGQLVIIKHNEAYLSAYGHTQAVRVREGESIRAGQAIATMGAGPTGNPMLYFEIRLHGQPINPQTLLPR